MTDNIYTPQLKIMGARTQTATGYLFTRRRLVALDNTTLEPVVAQWCYEGESDKSVGSSFVDTQPQKKLYVTAENYMGRVPLNVSNIDGNYFAVTVRKNDGEVTAWGLTTCGGVPPVSERNHDVVGFATSNQSVCALNAQGQVFSWGFKTQTGEEMAVPESVAALTDIISIKGTDSAMAALRSTASHGV